MSGPLHLAIEGIGAWSPGVPDWPAWQALLQGHGEVDSTAPAKPRPQRLAPGERRRAALHVLSAIEVAGQALDQAGREAASLPCVFASMHGDATIMDYMCAVLADVPAHISPTRFHNSVHNAAVGYWSIATGCHEATNAVAGLHASFGAALLEAASQALAERHPVLLVAHDEPGSGPLGEVLATRTAFACALVLSPCMGERDLARFELSLDAPATPLPPLLHPHAEQVAGDNPCGHAVHLLAALAGNDTAALSLPMAPGRTLGLRRIR